MSMITRTLISTICTLALGNADATLLGRDIRGHAVAGSDSTAVFLYDTDLDITWLRDANYAKTSGWDTADGTVDGLMSFADANSWTTSLSVGAYNGWRLPTSQSCIGYYCSLSEMSHLWTAELGNIPGSAVTTNPGDFLDIQQAGYWSGTESNSNFAYYFRMDDGYQTTRNKQNQLFAMAVRPGDVLSIPEPGTLALLALGLAGLSYSRRKE